MKTGTTVIIQKSNSNRPRPSLRVTIPYTAEDLLKLKKGDRLFVYCEGNRLVYQKCKE